MIVRRGLPVSWNTRSKALVVQVGVEGDLTSVALRLHTLSQNKAENSPCSEFSGPFFPTDLTARALGVFSRRGMMPSNELDLHLKLQVSCAWAGY